MQSGIFRFSGTHLPGKLIWHDLALAFNLKHVREIAIIKYIHNIYWLNLSGLIISLIKRFQHDNTVGKDVIQNEEIRLLLRNILHKYYLLKKSVFNIIKGYVVF